MPQAKSSRNEFIAGTFVLAMLGLAVASVVIVGGKSGGLLGLTKRQVRVAFPAEPGIRGLSEGSPVQFGGFQVGTVLKIDLGDETVIVTVSVRPDLKMTDKAVVAVLTNPLGGGGVLDIRRLGSGNPLTEDGLISAEQTLATNVLIEDALRGLGLERADQRAKFVMTLEATLDSVLRNLTALEKVLGSGEDLAVTLRGLRAMSDPQSGDLIALLRAARTELADGDLRQSLTAVRQLTTRLASPEWNARLEKLADLAGRVDQTLEATEKLLANSDAALAGVAQRANAALGKAQSAVERLDDLLARHGQTVDTLARDSTAAVADARTVMADLVAARPRVTTALVRLEGAVAAASELVSLNRPGVDLALRDLRAGAADFRRAIAEVRAAPWRLLLANYDDRAVANANILDAARAFNEGASSIEETVRRLETLLGTDGPPDPGPVRALTPTQRERLAEALAELRQRAARLSQTQGQLFDKLR